MKGKAGSILLVEDEVIIGMVCEKLLNRQGYSVMHALTGEDALTTVAKHHEHIDLILMDIDLGPGIDGIETARSISENYNIPIVFLTSHTDHDIIEKTYQVATYGYVIKSTEQAILAASIKSAIKLHENTTAIIASKKNLKTENEELQRQIAYYESGRGVPVPEIEYPCKSEERYRMIFTHSPIGIFQFNSSSVILDCNDEFVKIIGSAKSNIVGLNMLRQLKDSEMLDAINNAILGLTGSYEGLYRSVTAGKETYTRGVFISTKDADGSFSSGIGIFEDITERKNAELALKEKTDELESFFSTALDLFFIADSSGHFRRINPEWERTFGYSQEELIGKSYIDLVHDEDRKATCEKIKKLTESAPVIDFINRYMDREGAYRWVEWRALMSGDTIYTAARDITGRKKSEEIIKESLGEKEILLKELQHRVKNNLMIITGLLNLEMDNIADEQARQIMKKTVSRIHSMTSVYNQLLMSEGFNSINLKNYLNNIAGDLIRSYVLDSSLLKLTIILDDVFIDIRRAVPIGLIVTELITNSIKHSYKQKSNYEIRIELKKSENIVELSVSDNGPGFRNTPESDASSSMGLQLVKLLVQQIRGNIEFFVKDGALVCIDFPVNYYHIKTGG